MNYKVIMERLNEIADQTDGPIPVHPEDYCQLIEWFTGQQVPPTVENVGQYRMPVVALGNKPTELIADPTAARLDPGN